MGEPVPDSVFPRDVPFEKEERVISVFSDNEEFTWAFHEGPSKNFEPIVIWK